MTILILTSKNHWYANALLSGLMRQGAFEGDTVIVFEEDALVPGKSRLAGLGKYIRISGITYVFWQIVKQILFLSGRGIASATGQTTSSSYPYYLLKNVQRETVRGIKQSNIIRRVKKIRPDVILSVFSKEIIPSDILKIPRFGVVNLHPAPLPFYRGVSPVFWAMSENAKIHGVTLHSVDFGIDTGDIIKQTVFPIQKYKSEHKLYMRCVDEGIELVSSYLSAVKQQKQRIVGIPMKGKGKYRSVPTEDAVRTFLDRKMRFV